MGMVIGIRQEYLGRCLSQLFRPWRHKLSDIEVDKNQMLGKIESGAFSALDDGRIRILRVALELLDGCGMISRASSLLRSNGDLAHHGLSSRVHYSSVIFCNRLNLFGGSHV